MLNLLSCNFFPGVVFTLYTLVYLPLVLCIKETLYSFVLLCGNPVSELQFEKEVCGSTVFHFLKLPYI